MSVVVDTYTSTDYGKLCRIVIGFTVVLLCSITFIHYIRTGTFPNITFH